MADGNGEGSRGDPRDEPAVVEGRPGGRPPVARLARAGNALRGLAVDISPLRTSRDFRLLWTGELVSTIGRQITIVALAYQVFLLTHSSLAVGMIGLVELVPLVVCSIAGGALADRIDRRSLLIGTEFGLAAMTALLLLGAIHGHPPLWYLYSVTAAQAGMMGVNSPTRSAATPNLVPRRQLPAALALNQVLYTTTMVAGPAVGGVILARWGVGWAYAADLISYSAAIVAAFLLSPQPPTRAAHELPGGPWRDIRDGFRYLRGERVLISTFLIDLDAMIFGMPRALFPVLALDVFKVGAEGYGLLYAAPAVGAMIGALTTGWIGRVRHQGQAVIWAVLLWGAAIVGFGFSTRHFWLGLVLLAVAGGADVISAVFRNAILQLTVPDSLRGRLSAIHIMVVAGGPRLGDAEAGTVGALISPVFSVVSGGVACIAGLLLLVRFVPELARYRAAHLEDEPTTEGRSS